MTESIPTPAADPEALASLERKMQHVRTRVTGVAKGYSTGYYLCGSGGIGKSYTVLRCLDELEAAYRRFNSRMTARGLFQALEKAPDAVHVLEDMERLTKDRDAQGVLRSALWAPDGRDRVITWTTGTGGEEDVTFRGGIIMLANRPLADLPELRALATRIATERLDVTDAEMVAFIRDLAAKGFRRGGKLLLAAPESAEVAEHMIRECRAVGCPLDIRLWESSCLDYCQWRADHSAIRWEDLILTRVRTAADHFRHEADVRSPEEKKAHRRQVVREILAQATDAGEQERLYRERTGMSRADFFRRKREVESGEFDVSDSDA